MQNENEKDDNVELGVWQSGQRQRHHRMSLTGFFGDFRLIAWIC